MRKSAVLMVTVVLIVAIGSSVCAKPSGTIFRYLSPTPGARQVMPQSTLIFRPGDDLQRSGTVWTSSTVVTGSVSGVHEGRWTNADDSRTVIFRPDRPFESGEIVTVSCAFEVGGERAVYTHDFRIAPRIVTYTPDTFDKTGSGTDEMPAEAYSGGSPPLDMCRKKDGDKKKRRDCPGTYSLPPDFPTPEITVYDEPEDGKLFLANITPRMSAPVACYMMILEKDGTPCFFRKMPGRIVDFKKQPCGLLSYAWTKPGDNYFHTMDNTYSAVDSYTTVDGYDLDSHDFLMLPNGHVMLIGDDPEIMDMSQIVEGGDTAALVIGSVIQELDAAKNLVFQWRTRDHYDILDTNTDLTAGRIRYSHVNAIEVDHDGNIMISSRHMSEVTKIDRDTGQIIWRMGGNKNEFTLEGDTQWFSRQHDIRRLDNGHVTVYDNGNLNDPQESRAVEYALDEENMIATRVWEFRNDPPIYAGAQGSARRLPGGNTLIGWGNCREVDITEVRPDGTIAFELILPPGLNTYRAFKYQWEGVAAEPYAWADTTGGELWLDFTKFGDSEVNRYFVYRGTSPSPDWKAYVTCGNSVRIRDFEADEPLHFRVTAVDRCGNVSPYSNEVVITPGFADDPEVKDAIVKVTPSTLNLLSEGRWVTAQIEFPCESGLHVSDIDRTCILFNDTILVDHTGGNGNIKKSAKKKLMVKFPRDEITAILPAGCVTVKVSGYVGELAFEAFDSIMVISADSSCAGDGDEDNEEDVAEGEKERGERPVSEKVALFRNFPNPFNPMTTISFTLSASSHVNLSIYDVSGRLVRTLADRTVDEGTHEMTWDGRGLNGEQAASGIYFYKLRTDREVLTRKMVLLR